MGTTIEQDQPVIRFQSQGIVPLENLECLSERELYFFIILSSDVHFCHDTPRHSGFDLPLARYCGYRKLRQI